MELLPPEVVVRVLDFVGDRDLCAARAAHSCFRVHTLDHLHRTRRNQRWLRMPLDGVCRRGRTDILAFLYKRKRVPVSIHMAIVAVESGDIDVLRFVCQRDCSRLDAHRPGAVLGRAAKLGRLDMVRLLWANGWKEGDALLEAARAGHLDIVQFLVAQGRSHYADHAIEAALCSGRADIARAIIESPSAVFDVSLAVCHALRHENAQVADLLWPRVTRRDLQLAVATEAEIGCIDLVRSLCERFPDLPIDSLLNSARVHRHPEIVTFLSKHQRRMQSTDGPAE
ncbi:Ankyrin repeat domain containing protein [Pandoravirus salinus]|uniref:Ankyrin repeat domain containing protein n=1 Tax=Pandoravirus salinus TaxID=1349410 RepID=A0A291ATQ3_9VIRU|nr:ankyrin repeat domain [Pandoravirus salinus]ATE82272.1 Ankyrin repeat domain containing protein [Pandoravirus salinus]